MHTNIPNIHLSVVIILSFRRSLTHTYSYVHYTIKNQEFQEKEKRKRIFISYAGGGVRGGFFALRSQSPEAGFLHCFLGRRWI